MLLLKNENICEVSPQYVQMGKDVVTFLSWAAEPEMEERKLVCPFSNSISIIIFGLSSAYLVSFAKLADGV